MSLSSNCGKICYHSRKDAKQGAKRVAATVRGNSIKLRPYKCPVCPYWHNHSQSAKQVENWREYNGS